MPAAAVLGPSRSHQAQKIVAEIKDFDPLTYFTPERLKLLHRVSQLAVVAAAVWPGAKPHAESEQRTEPWGHLGISRATYYRRKRIRRL